MQAGIEQAAGARQLAAAHQGDEERVLDQLALGMAAADAHDLSEDRRELAHAGGVILIREGRQRAADRGHHGAGRQLAVGEALLDHG